MAASSIMTMTEPAAEIPRYEITHSDVTVEAVVVQVDGKTVVQPIQPMVVRTGESFTISGTVTLTAD
jgi:hypothetical protein